ncbi:MAG: hypothetical protein V1739_04885 [Candidatus Omnitrophota bacterium]
MLDILEKIILASVGLASMTKEKAEELVDVLIKKGQVKAKDRNAALSKLLRGTEKFDKDLEKKMKQVSLKIVDSSEKQIDRIKKKLAKIAKDLHFEKKE